MVKNSEHHRTTLQTMLDLEAQIQGSTAGFNIPKFIVDLPGGGGKRIASTLQSYDRETGVSTFEAPAVTGSAAARGTREKPQVFEYYDPIDHGDDARVTLDEKSSVNLDEKSPLKLDEKSPATLDEQSPVTLNKKRFVNLDGKRHMFISRRGY